MRLLTFILILAGMLLSSCEKGDPLANQDPETKIFVSEINRSGDNRLTSEVRLSWSGTDIDGYVVAYELSFDNLNWTKTTATDSTFIFDLSSGSDTLNVDFWVRAIDNDGNHDQSPAYLEIPIKNSPPSAVFDSSHVLNDTSWIVFTTKMSFSDPDGDETLDSAYIRINGGAWYSFSPQINLLTIVPVNPESGGAVMAEVYSGTEASLLKNQIDGLLMNSTNTLELRAKDVSGSFSSIDTSSATFVKNKSGELLVIRSHGGGGSPDPDDVYLPVLQQLNGGFDYINIQKNNAENLPALINPTLGFLLNEYDRVFWFADNSEVNNQLYLELASDIIQEYLNTGGKILISATFPSDIENTSPVLDFSPIDSFSTSVGQARVPNDSLIMPYGDFDNNYDTLASGSFITGADPFYPKDSSNIMYSAQITRISGWSGPNIVCASTRNGGNINQVFISLELHLLDGIPGRVETFMREVLENEFNW